MPRFRRVFFEAVEHLRAGINTAQLEAYLARGDHTLAVHALPFARFRSILDRGWTEALMETQQAGMRAARRPAELALDSHIVLKQAVGRFDLVNPRAVRWAGAEAAKLLNDVTPETMMAVRAIIVRAQAQGLTIPEQSRLIREFVGLTRRQADAVLNFREALIAQGADAAFVAKQTDRFRDRAIRRRATLIARTETIKAGNRGQQELWEQAAEQGFLDKARTRRVWIVTPDDRLCPYCEDMGAKYGPGRGGGVGLDEKFGAAESQLKDGSIRTMEPQQTPPLHPGCRCAMALEFSD